MPAVNKMTKFCVLVLSPLWLYALPVSFELEGTEMFHYYAQSCNYLRPMKNGVKLRSAAFGARLNVWLVKNIRVFEVRAVLKSD